MMLFRFAGGSNLKYTIEILELLQKNKVQMAKRALVSDCVADDQQGHVLITLVLTATLSNATVGL